VLGDERLDVGGVLRLLAHHREDPVLLALPVAGQLGEELVEEPPRLVEREVVQGAYGVPAERRGPLVLGDVVPDQRHLTAAAVVAHATDPTTAPRLLGCP
jgi:hypothetical protein